MLNHFPRRVFYFEVMMARKIPIDWQEIKKNKSKMGYDTKCLDL